MKNAGVENNKLLYYDVDNKIWRCIMKAHKYWSTGAIVTMVGTFYTGYKGLKAAHKYFAFGSLTVSYTHLDVYKRQVYRKPRRVSRKEWKPGCCTGRASQTIH